VTTVTPTFEAPYVRDDFAALRGAFVVAPSADIAIAAPVHAESSPIFERAADQFRILVGRLAAAGVKVATLVEPDATTPLGSAAADLAVVFEDGAFLMRPSEARRRPEVALLEAALERANVPVTGRVEAPGLLDGGDVLLSGDTVYIGCAQVRSSDVGLRAALHGNALGRAQLAAHARSKGLKVVEVSMSAAVRSLRAVASLLDSQTLLFAPALVDGAAFAGMQTIEAPRGEDYGAGVLALGNRRVLANLRFRETIPLLRAAKFAVDAIDLWEFGKAGVTPSTLALALKRSPA
jgi:dimethylargininase